MNKSRLPVYENHPFIIVKYGSENTMGIYTNW
jgi:hypothetical protein